MQGVTYSHLDNGVINLPHSPLEASGDFVKYRPKTKEKIATISEDLFQLRLKRKMFKRKESEMDYRLQDIILEEEYHFRSMELQNIASSALRGDHYETEGNNTKEERLFYEMMDIVKKRDQLLLDLDIERLREMEEDGEVIDEYHQLKQVLERYNMTTSSKAEIAEKQEHHSENIQGNKMPIAATTTITKDTRFRKISNNRTFDARRKFGKLSCSIS